jgi:hypothetical protein
MDKQADVVLRLSTRPLRLSSFKEKIAMLTKRLCGNSLNGFRPDRTDLDPSWSKLTDALGFALMKLEL